MPQVNDNSAGLLVLAGSTADELIQLQPEDGKTKPAHMVLVLAMNDRSFGLAGYPINPFAVPTVTTSTDRIPWRVRWIPSAMQRVTFA